MRYAGPPRFVAFERLRGLRGAFDTFASQQGFVCTLQSFYHLKQINLVVYTRASRLRDESLNNIRPWRCVHYIQRVVCRHATRVKRGFLVTARSARPARHSGLDRPLAGLASPASPVRPRQTLERRSTPRQSGLSWWPGTGCHGRRTRPGSPIFRAAGRTSHGTMQ